MADLSPVHVYLADNPESQSLLTQFDKYWTRGNADLESGTEPLSKYLVQAFDSNTAQSVLSALASCKEENCNLLALGIDSEHHLEHLISGIRWKHGLGNESQSESKMIAGSSSLQSSSAISLCLEELSEGLSTHIKSDRFAQTILQAASELLSNAFYHGPIDAQGTPLYSELSRKEVVHLQAGESIEFGCYISKNEISIRVEDCFGSLNPAALIDKFASNHNQQQAHTGTGGAGIGLFQTFLSANCLSIRCNPSQSTQTEVVFHLCDRVKQRQLAGKGLQII
jgi:hypothetical protein